MKNQNHAPKATDKQVNPVMEIVKPDQDGKKSGLQETAVDVLPVSVTKEIRIISLEELKRKGEMLTNLSKRHEEVSEKFKRLENFSVLHDNSTAEILMKDANGETFKSHSPEAISKYIEICKEEFKCKLADIESQMREIA